MSAAQIIAKAIEQEQNNNATNQKLLESILDKITVMEANSKISNEFLIGYYDMKVLSSIINLCPASIYNRIEKDEFPKQVNLGLRSVGWCKKEIQTWIEINNKRGFDYISKKGWTNIYIERYQN